MNTKDDVLDVRKMYPDFSAIPEDSKHNDLQAATEFNHPHTQNSKGAVDHVFGIAWEVLAVHLNENSPYLKPSASKEEALEAVQELISAFEPGMELVRDSIYDTMQDLMTTFVRAQRVYSRLWKKKLQAVYATSLRNVKLLQDNLPRKVVESYQDMKPKYLVLLQEWISYLLNNSSPEVQDWWYIHHNVFTEHLIVEESRPEVDLSGANGVRRAQLTSRPTLPLEMATSIMSHCSLESCVTLRQVSRVFFQAFHHVDLESVVKARCPWFRLEGDLRSWSDCALVFVQRQKSDKWKSLYSLQVAGVRPLKENPPRLVRPVELENLEKLPADFEPVNRHIDGDMSPCGAIHSDERRVSTTATQYKVLDIKTLSVSSILKPYDWRNASVDYRPTGTVIQAGNVEITLPPGTGVDTYLSNSTLHHFERMCDPGHESDDEDDLPESDFSDSDYGY
ncbi:hypothetical protein CJU90_4442 [Yarrowia sp. C11]|nr:hypothetical protein CJU90_4442 [Yarrowia sp. C11]